MPKRSRGPSDQPSLRMKISRSSAQCIVTNSGTKNSNDESGTCYETRHKQIADARDSLHRDMANDLKKIENEKSELETQINQLKSDLRDSSDFSSKLNDELKGANEKVLEKDQKIAEMEKEMHDWQRKEESATKKLLALKEKFMDLTTQLNSAKKELAWKICAIEGAKKSLNQDFPNNPDNAEVLGEAATNNENHQMNIENLLNTITQKEETTSGIMEYHN